MQRGRTARRAGVEYAGAGAEAEDTGAGAVVSGSQIMQLAGRTRQACVGPGRAYLRTRRESQYMLEGLVRRSSAHLGGGFR